MLINIYKGALKALLMTFLRWKVLSKLVSTRRAPIPVFWIIHRILDPRILLRWKVKPQKPSLHVTWLNQSERTDPISRGHDESCQSNVFEWALEKAIIRGISYAFGKNLVLKTLLNILNQWRQPPWEESWQITVLWSFRTLFIGFVHIWEFTAKTLSIFNPH